MFAMALCSIVNPERLAAIGGDLFIEAVA